MTEAYPLQWPQGRPRTKCPERSRFDVTQDTAQYYLFDELRQLGARNIILSTNLELRRDGLPYASRRPPDDKGIAVYFKHKDRDMVFSCDRWNRVGDNIQAVRHTIAALRGIERWGSGDAMEAAFTGFQALPAPSERPWREVFGIDASTGNLEWIKVKYKQLAKERHPDIAGSDTLMAELNVAFDRAKMELSQ